MSASKNVKRSKLFLFFFLGMSFFTSCHDREDQEAKIVVEIIEELKDCEADSLIFIDYYSLKGNYYSPINLTKRSRKTIEGFIDNHVIKEIHGSFSDAVEIILSEKMTNLINEKKVSGVIYTQRDFSTTDKYFDLSDQKDFEYELMQPYYYRYSYVVKEDIGG